MDWGQGDLTVQNLFDTEYYEECVRKAREWNEKGYILPDASTNPDTGVAYFKTGKVASTMSLIHPGVPTDSTNMTGIPCSTAIVNPAFGNTQTVGAVIQSIPVSCKNPEKCWSLSICFIVMQKYIMRWYGVLKVHTISM